MTDEELAELREKMRAEVLAELQPAEPPTQEIVHRLTIDTSKLTIGDQETLLRLPSVKEGDTNPEHLLLQADSIALMDRVIVGGVRHLPLSDLPMVMEQMRDALQRAGDRQGNSRRGS